MKAQSPKRRRWVERPIENGSEERAAGIGVAGEGAGGRRVVEFTRQSLRARVGGTLGASVRSSVYFDQPDPRSLALQNLLFSA